MRSNNRRLVWDLPLRPFHWLFAASILACWGTAQLGFALRRWHIWIGYWIMGLFFFRLIWGFTGPKHARFTSFLKGPSAVLNYARGLTGLDGVVSSVGHNPLGGLMVIFMLMLVTVQVYTGLFSTDDIAWSGPYNSAVSDATAERLTGLHHRNFNFIWGAIGLHVAAILYYAFVKKENLVSAMLTGWKPAQVVPADQAIAGSSRTPLPADECHLNQALRQFNVPPSAVV